MILNQALQDHVADAVYDVFDGGVLKIFGGDRIIVTIPLPSPAFEPAENGKKAVNGIWRADATMKGIADNCRFESSDKTYTLEGTVTKKGDGGDVELINTNIETGQPVEITDGEGLVQ